MMHKQICKQNIISSLQTMSLNVSKIQKKLTFFIIFVVLYMYFKYTIHGVRSTVNIILTMCTKKNAIACFGNLSSSLYTQLRIQPLQSPQRRTHEHNHGLHAKNRCQTLLRMFVYAVSIIYR